MKRILNVEMQLFFVLFFYARIEENGLYMKWDGPTPKNEEKHL